jgi:hypothetical protein
MQASQLPNYKFPIPFANSASAQYQRTIPKGSQQGIIDGAASLADGFPPKTFIPVNSGGTPPFGQDFNGLLNAITAWTRWQNAGGLVTFDSTFAADIGGYPMGAILMSATPGRLWLSTTDNNTTNPDVSGTDGTGWTSIVTSAVRSYFQAGDVNVNISANDSVVATNVVLTAPRVWTLPLASSVPAGTTIALIDPDGAVSSANTITIACSGSDTINGQVTEVLSTSFFQLEAYSDGLSRWTFQYVDLSQIPGYAITIAGLQSGLTSLLAQLAALRAFFLAEIAALRASLTASQTTTSNQGVGATYSGIDYFVDESQCTPSFPGYNCLVGQGQGLTFKPGSTAQTNFTLANPFAANPATSSLSGYTALGVQSQVNASDPGPIATTISIQQLPAVTQTVTQRGLPRVRSLYGAQYTAGSTNQLLMSGDPTRLFGNNTNDFTYNPVWGNWVTPTTALVQNKGLWQYTAAKDYWTPILATSTTNGWNGFVQSYKFPFALVTTGFFVPFVPSGSGQVRILLMKSKSDGSPDFSNVIADRTLTAGGASTDPNTGAQGTPMTFAPTYIAPNATIHACFISSVGGTLTMSNSVGYATAFLAQTAGNFTTYGPQFADMTMYGLNFNASGQISFLGSGNIVLSSGINSIDLSIPAIIPDGCSVDVLLNGKSMATTDPSVVFAGAPTSVGFQLVLYGNGVVTPIVDTANMKVWASQGGTSFLNESATFTMPSPESTVVESAILSGYNPAVHTYAEMLEAGSSPSTLAAAVATTGTPTPVAQSDGTYLVTSTWSLSSPASAIRFRRQGTTTDATQQYRVVQANRQAH